MRVLLVGGSGLVGTFITPYLREHHELRVLDPRPPSHADLVEYVQGSMADPDDLARALNGMDTFINVAMRSPNYPGLRTEQDVETIINNYETNTLGLHLLLWTAQGQGITRGIHTSTLTVHDRERTQYPSEESVPRDSPTVYGFTKGLGETICEYFTRWFDMHIIAMRITGPRRREDYIAERRVPKVPGLYVTDEEDVARAYLAALDTVQVGSSRFDAVFIAGDEHEQVHNLSKARQLLGWMPESQKYLDE